MSAIQELKDLLVEQGTTFEAYKAANDLRIKQIVDNGEANGDVVAKLDQIETDLGDVGARIGKAEAKIALPGRLDTGDDQTPEQKEHFDAFANFIRNPKDTQALGRLQAAQKSKIKMEVSVGTPAGGGYALPEQIDRNISEKIVDISPMRSIVQVVNVGTSDYKHLVNVHGGGFEWLGEGDTVNTTNTPTFAEVAPTFGKGSSFMIATEESLDDLFFPVQGVIEDEAALQHAGGEGLAIISGNGTNKPTGFRNATPSDITDEGTGGSPLAARPFGTCQYLPTGASAGFASSSTSPIGDAGDVLINTVYAVKAAYRSNARWLANKSTLATVRKFKDSDGNYLWAPGIAGGEPSTLLGYPITEAEDMQDVAANAFPLAFGDFRAGYLLCDLVGTRITIDPYTTPGKVKFYIRRRVGGIMKNDDAIKLVKCSLT